MTKGNYRMKPGTELVLLTETKRNPWKLIQYIDDDILCIESEDGKQIQCYKKDVALRHSMNIHRKAKQVIETLVNEFENPDNHAHQRSAIEEGKEFLNNS